MGGLKPVVELMTVNFGLLALDQIVNNAAKIHYMFGGHAKVPVVIRAPQGAGHQLGAQHSQSLEAYFLHCPGLRVAIPATPADAKGLLKTCIRQENPVMFSSMSRSMASRAKCLMASTWCRLARLA